MVAHANSISLRHSNRFVGGDYTMIGAVFDHEVYCNLWRSIGSRLDQVLVTHYAWHPINTSKITCVSCAKKYTNRTHPDAH